MATTTKKPSEEQLRAAIRKHVSSFWPSSSISEEAWLSGPIQDSLPGFHVLRLESGIAGRPQVYVTNGCFLSDPTAHPYLEFFLLSPYRDQTNVETLTMLADFHADPQYRIGLGDTLDIGRPWLKGSECDHLLISLPYPYGPKLEWLNVGDACVRFLWAMPITSREAAFADRNEPEALERKFDEAKPDYLDPSRPSVV